MLSEVVLKDADLSVLTRKAWGYAVTPQGNQYLQSLGVRSIGFCRTSESLLEALSNDPLQPVNNVIADASQKSERTPSDIS